MNRKWITITANFRSGGEQYFAGERLFQPAETADRWVKAGWAKDESGEVATGAPDTSAQTLQVRDGVLNASTDKA